MIIDLMKDFVRPRENCVVCGSETKWNERVNRYNRFCENPKCKEIYRESFRRSKGYNIYKKEEV